MKKAIVTTTINPPTEATIKFAQKCAQGWEFIIIGDTKTPHPAYRALEQQYPGVIYIDPDQQEQQHKTLSDSIGWRSIQRRNIGFVEAYRRGADIVATVDDDNIPYEHWGKNLLVGTEVEIDLYEPAQEVFDPLSVTKANHLWHRGFPIQLLQGRLQNKHLGKTKRHVLVQADLWEGDPDIDALARLTFRPEVEYKDITHPYGGTTISPFNSQNTFLHRSVLPYYAVLPHVGRMDDIWGGYIMQRHFPQSVVYNTASVYQARNPQDLIMNLEKEILGYRQTLNLLQNLESFITYLPDETKVFWEAYRSSFSEHA